MVGKQGRFQVLLEDGVQGECNKCGKSIKQFELVVTETGREYFHCGCYRVPPFLHLDDGIVLPRTVYSENSKKLKDWIAAHNRSLKFPLPLTRKVVVTESCASAQALVPVFQFLTPKEVLGAEVSRAWYHAAWSEVVWGGASRTVFAQTVQSACFTCKTQVREDNLGLLCPQTNRPLCRECRQKEEMQLVRVDALCRALGIDPRNAKSELAEKGLQVRGQNVIFWGVGVKKVAEMRKKRRDHLAGILKYDDSLKEVLQVALDQPLQEDNMKNQKAKQISALKVNLSAKKKKKT